MPVACSFISAYWSCKQIVTLPQFSTAVQMPDSIRLIGSNRPLPVFYFNKCNKWRRQSVSQQSMTLPICSVALDSSLSLCVGCKTRLDLEVQTWSRQRKCHIKLSFGHSWFPIDLGRIHEPVWDKVSIFTVVSQRLEAAVVEHQFLSRMAIEILFQTRQFGNSFLLRNCWRE